MNVFWIQHFNKDTNYFVYLIIKILLPKQGIYPYVYMFDANIIYTLVHFIQDEKKNLAVKNIALKIFDKISPFVSFSGEEVLLQQEVTTNNGNNGS